MVRNESSLQTLCFVILLSHLLISLLNVDRIVSLSRLAVKVCLSVEERVRGREGRRRIA